MRNDHMIFMRWSYAYRAVVLCLSRNGHMITVRWSYAFRDMIIVRWSPRKSVIPSAERRDVFHRDDHMIIALFALLAAVFAPQARQPVRRQPMPFA